MRDIFPRSGGENKFIAESFGNRTSGFQQRFQMRLGGLLKTERGLAAIPSMRVTAWQRRRLGDPHAIFILTKVDF